MLYTPNDDLSLKKCLDMNMQIFIPILFSILFYRQCNTKKESGCGWGLTTGASGWEYHEMVECGCKYIHFLKAIWKRLQKLLKI